MLLGSISSNFTAVFSASSSTGVSGFLSGSVGGQLPAGKSASALAGGLVLGCCASTQQNEKHDTTATGNVRKGLDRNDLRCAMEEFPRCRRVSWLLNVKTSNVSSWRGTTTLELPFLFGLVNGQDPRQPLDDHSRIRFRWHRSP